MTLYPTRISLHLYIYIIGCAVAVCLSLMACSDTLAHYETKGLDREQWTRSDTLTFHMPVMPQKGEYDAIIDLRFTDRYPFMTLTLQAQQTVHGSGNNYTDTLTLQVYNNNGLMTGNGLNLIDYTVPLRTYTLSPHDSVTVSLCHIMSGDTLKGITDIGMRLIRH